MDYRVPTRGRLFLVDDDPDVVAALKLSFEADGYDVVALANGEALLDAAPEPNGCIIIDYRLPGMSGLDILAKLRAGGVATPAILITSHPSPALKKRASQVAVEIVEKPLIGEGLARRVAELMR